MIIENKNTLGIKRENLGGRTKKYSRLEEDGRISMCDLSGTAVNGLKYE